MADTNDVLRTIHTSFTKKTGDLLILSKAHRKRISDYVETQDAANVLVAWLGYLWDCEEQPDWNTTKLKAHRFLTNIEGCYARGSAMLPFTREQLQRHGRENNLGGWLCYLLERIQEVGVKVMEVAK